MKYTLIILDPTPLVGRHLDALPRPDHPMEFYLQALMAKEAVFSTKPDRTYLVECYFLGQSGQDSALKCVFTKTQCGSTENLALYQTEFIN